MFRSLLSFEGRTGRETFFMVGALILVAKLCMVFAAAGLTAGAVDAPDEAIARSRWTAWSVSAVLDLLLLWPLVALNVRRAHDRGASGRHEAALVILATFVGMVPAQLWRALPDVAEHAMTGMVWGVLGLTMFLQVCFPGTEGANIYGPPPRARESVA